jgi:hypothetical protein
VELAEAYKTETHWSRQSAGRVAELTEIVARERAGKLLSRAEALASAAPSAAGETDYLPERFEL